MRVQDARGRWHDMPALRTRHTASDDAAERLNTWYHFAQYDSVVRSRTGDVVPRVMLWVIGALFLVVGVVILGTGRPGWGALMALIGPACVVSSIFVPLMQRAAHRQARANLEPCLGHCPACDYGLSGLATQYDGCVVCPECGGAWRISEPPRFGHP